MDLLFKRLRVFRYMKEGTMNIAFFLLPKQEVMSVNEDATLRQTLERMERHRYAAVPVISEKGEYKATVTEGDLLWYLKSHPELSFDQLHRVSLCDVPLRMNNLAVRIDANMEDLISLAKTQNFVPVVDDMNRFIGIVRRSDIIDYCEQLLLPFNSNEKELKREA
jgi:CBS-domain-containing membrane protein